MKVSTKSNIKIGLEKFGKVLQRAEKNALKKGGLQLINWMINGSPQNARVLPVLTGTLRGSGSVFQGSELIDTTGWAANTTHTDKENVTTIGFNTPYAAWLHEAEWNPGPISRQSGNTGNKYVEYHLDTDGKRWLIFVAKMINKGIKEEMKQV